MAVGPRGGGIFTTYFSRRWVFAGEVPIVVTILILARKIADGLHKARLKLDASMGRPSPAKLIAATTTGRPS